MIRFDRLQFLLETGRGTWPLSTRSIGETITDTAGESAFARAVETIYDAAVTVSEVFLLGIAAHVLERKDGDGGLFWEG